MLFFFNSTMLLTIIITLIIIPIVYFILTYVNHLRKLKDYPDGPFPLPVIGNLNHLSSKPYADFQRLTKTYGGVFSFSFGMNRYVIVNSPEAMKEVLITHGPDFAGRPTDVESLKLISRGSISLGLSEGPLWKLLRKITHTTIKSSAKQYGDITASIERECEDLHEVLREKNGAEIDPKKEIGRLVINVISKIVFGDRYTKDDEEFKEIVKFQELVFAGLQQTDIVVFLPWLRFFKTSGYEKLKSGIAIRDPILKRKLKKHKENFDPEKIKDFTSHILKLSKDVDFLKRYGMNELTDDHLELLINDLFVAGNETTATVLCWFVVYMIHWPHHQEEMFKEITTLLNSAGGEECENHIPHPQRNSKDTEEYENHIPQHQRYPNIDDRVNLPYTNACILETFRYAAVVPLGIPRRTLKTTVIDGKKIPQNTTVLLNLWHASMSEEYWENPTKFDPTRWLGEKGEQLKISNKYALLPFSAGIRNCPGDVLAKTEIFIIIARLMHDFRIEKAEKLPSLVGDLGITLFPHPFKARFIPRNKME